jgi:hypothetical protein
MAPAPVIDVREPLGGSIGASIQPSDSSADLLPAIRLSQHSAILQMQVQRADSFAANDRLRLTKPRTKRNENRTLSGGFHESTSA